METWNKILDQIKTTINPQSFNTWFVPIVFTSFKDNVLKLKAKNEFFADWIQEHYLPLIKTKAELVTQQPVEVVVETGSPDATPDAAPIPSFKPVTHKADYLNDRYVFDNFVVGNSNQFAYSAARAVAEAPGETKFNPLLIYGDTGLGKTHLIQAVGQYVLQQNPKARVYYTTSEQFTFDFIESIKNNKITELSNYYRSADVLLMDDIQFFIAKERTQEEFFHIFNTLYQNQKQIILSSDRAPRDLQGLEERLISRFQWGLFVDIQPPDKETQIAIIRKKTEAEELNLPEEVVNLITDNSSANIRELEGTIIKLMAYSSLTKKDITLELAQRILKTSFKPAKRISVDLIIEAVAKYYGIQENAIREKTRSKEVVLPRQVSMYLAKQLTDYSLKTIGLSFGGRDHSTVIHALGVIEGRIKSEPVFAEELEEIKRTVSKN